VIFDFGMSVGLFTTIAGLGRKNWRGGLNKKAPSFLRASFNELLSELFN